MCHPDVEFQSVLGLTGRAYIGHDGIREYFDDAESAWEQWDVEQVTEAANGRVAIVMTMHARGKESGAGLAPAHRARVDAPGRQARRQPALPQS